MLQSSVKKAQNKFCKGSAKIQNILQKYRTFCKNTEHSAKSSVKKLRINSAKVLQKYRTFCKTSVKKALASIWNTGKPRFLNPTKIFALLFRKLFHFPVISINLYRFRFEPGFRGTK